MVVEELKNTDPKVLVKLFQKLAGSRDSVPFALRRGRNP